MEPMKQHEQLALLEMSLINLRKVRESLDEDAPAALTQKLQVAATKILAAKGFLEAGWIRCPNCKRVSYNKNDIDKQYCVNCARFHDQFDPITTQEKSH